MAPRRRVMNVCGKPVRFLGRVSSGSFTHCTRIAGHAGDCEDGDSCEEGGAGQATPSGAKTVIAQNTKWPFKAKQTGGGDEQAGDSTLPPALPEIPEGIVIQ